MDIYNDKFSSTGIGIEERHGYTLSIHYGHQSLNPSSYDTLWSTVMCKGPLYLEPEELPRSDNPI